MRKIKWLSKALPIAFLLISLSNARADLIKGEVLGPDGKPVPNAQVWLQPFSDDASGEYEKLPLDAAGKFQVEAKSANYSPIFFGRVVIYEPGFALGGGSLGKRDNIYRLQKAQPISGRVLDKNEKPISGARVVLNFVSFGIEPQSAQYIFVRESPLEEKFAVLTDKDGNWKMEAASEGARFSILVAAPGFATNTQQIVFGQEATTHLSAGAALAGRVNYENGKPAAGIKVSANSQDQYGNNASWGEAVSAADGTFRIEGLRPGAHSVYVATINDDWVGDTKGATAAAGQTVALPDLVLTEGVFIEGTTQDEKGTPISGVQISAQGPQLSPMETGLFHTAISDKKGAYRLRVAPGKYQLNLASHPPEFVSPEIGSAGRDVIVTIAESETKTVPFVLPRGLEISGVARDAKGTPVPGVLLSLKPVTAENNVYAQGAFAYSEDDGSWKAVGLKPGKYNVEASGEWKIVAPLEIEVPRGESVTVKIEPQTYFTLRGRVQSVDGKPVAGVGVQFSISVPEGKYSSVAKRTVVSDENGWYEIPKLKGIETVRFLSASKPGFLYSKGGDLLENADKSTYSTIVMSLMNAKLAGIVIDADKKPVADARVVSPGAIPKAETKTDANGKFVLENLAQGFVQILAIHPEKGAVLSRQISDGSDVDLQLIPLTPAPAPDVARGEKILQEASLSSDGKSYQQAQIAYAMLPFDFERAEKLAVDANGKTTDIFVARVLYYLGINDPKKAVEWGTAHLEEAQSAWLRPYVIGRLGIAAAEQNPPLAQQMYEQLQNSATGEGDIFDAALLYQAQLAAKLSRPETSALVDKALANSRAAALKTPNRSGSGAMIAEAMAEVDGAQAERVLQLLQGDEKNQAVGRVVKVLAKRGDAASVAMALKLINDFEKSDEKNSGFHFSSAATELIAALGKTDPAAALALARRVTHSYFKAQALVLAAQAQTDDATMGVLLRDAGTSAISHQAPVAQLAQIAIIAFPRFPELTRELADQAMRINQENKSDENGYALTSGTQDGAQNLGIALSLFDKSAAREFLELEWLDASEASQKGQAASYRLPGIIRAMANVDFERALKMTRTLPESETQRADQQSQSFIDLARWLMTEPEKRALLWNSFQPRDNGS